MNTLLLLNGPEGWQTGIEDGFNSLLNAGKIRNLKWFYFEEFAKTNSYDECKKKIYEIAVNFSPELIVIFHIGKFPFNELFLKSLKKLPSKPFIAYDEGDMYGGIAKPVSESMKILFKQSDVVSLRGLGEWYKFVSKYNKNIIYTPHHSDIYRFDHNSGVKSSRSMDVILIGNRIRRKFLPRLYRLPGAVQREQFVAFMGKEFPTKFKVYGNGWDSFIGNQGPVDFQSQIDYYQNTWITVAYEHYPKIPYYFSNRLPIALLSGSLYVCHYHEGYEKIFNEGDFIFFFKTETDAVDIVNYLFSLGKKDLYARAMRAREYSIRNFSPEVVWKNFMNNVNTLMGNR